MDSPLLHMKDIEHIKEERVEMWWLFHNQFNGIMNHKVIKAEWIYPTYQAYKGRKITKGRGKELNSVMHKIINIK